MIPQPTILLWGVLDDPPIAAAHQALLEANAPVLLLDQNHVLDTTADLLVGPHIEGCLHYRGQTIDLAHVTSLYLRPIEACKLPAVSRVGPESVRHAATVDDLLTSWADLTPALVLNRPTPMAANNAKPFQSAWIQSLGFRTPETLLTTDPAQALAFWQHHGRVIYKSISGIRSIVAELTPAHRDRLAGVAACPTQFQQFIPGTEYRVHVVGPEIFACTILSNAIDYRYSPIPYQLHPCTLPPEVAARCLHLSQAMRLPLAGLDLRLTPQGEWFCFEVNPCPAFSCFEPPGTQAIAQSVARLLTATQPDEPRVRRSTPRKPVRSALAVRAT